MPPRTARRLAAALLVLMFGALAFGVGLLFSLADGRPTDISLYIGGALACLFIAAGAIIALLAVADEVL